MKSKIAKVTKTSDIYLSKLYNDWTFCEENCRRFSYFPLNGNFHRILCKTFSICNTLVVWWCWFKDGKLFLFRELSQQQSHNFNTTFFLLLRWKIPTKLNFHGCELYWIKSFQFDKLWLQYFLLVNCHFLWKVVLNIKRLRVTSSKEAKTLSITLVKSAKLLLMNGV